MDQSLRQDADLIIQSSLQAVLPDAAVRRALQGFRARGGRTFLKQAPVQPATYLLFLFLDYLAYNISNTINQFIINSFIVYHFIHTCQ